MQLLIRLTGSSMHDSAKPAVDVLGSNACIVPIGSARLGAYFRASEQQENVCNMMQELQQHCAQGKQQLPRYHCANKAVYVCLRERDSFCLFLFGFIC